MPITLSTSVERDSTVRTTVLLFVEGCDDARIRYTFCDAGHVGRAEVFASKLARTFTAVDAILTLDAALDIREAGHMLLARGELSFCSALHRIERNPAQSDIMLDEAGSGEMRLEHPRHCLCRSPSCTATITL